MFHEVYSVETGLQIDGFIACTKCPKVLRYTSKTGTTNALTHFGKHETVQQTATLDSFVMKEKFSISAADKTNLIEAGVSLVSKDLRPFSTVEGEGMIDFAHAIWKLGAKYGNIKREELVDKMPCARTISRNVRIKAKDKKVEMHQLLLNALERSPFITVTCDIWQDNYKRISYVGATAHFQNESSNLCDQVIALKPLDWRQKKDHTFIRETIKSALEANRLPFDNDKIFFVTDRGSNVKKALRDFTRLNCFPHFLNNTAKESCNIDIIKETLSACGDLVRYIKISGLNNEFEISLKSHSPTRFNSNLAMVDSIILNYDRLENILIRENESERLEEIQKDILLQIKSFLVPIKKWSDFTESSKKSSLFAVWIAIDSIIKHCTVKEDDEHVTTLMKTKALCYLEKRFELHSLHRLSTYLHPNFKNLRFASPSLFQCTINDAKELLQKYPETNHLVAPERRSSTSSDSSVDSELSNYQNDFVDEDEVDKYQRMNFVFEANVDLIKWWTERKSEFPHLSKLATAIHTIPASSTPAERFFSMSGAVITDRRSNIDPEAVEDILILRSDSNKFDKHSIWQTTNDCKCFKA